MKVVEKPGESGSEKRRLVSESFPKFGGGGVYQKGEGKNQGKKKIQNFIRKGKLTGRTAKKNGINNSGARTWLGEGRKCRVKNNG